MSNWQEFHIKGKVKSPVLFDIAGRPTKPGNFRFIIDPGAKVYPSANGEGSLDFRGQWPKGSMLNIVVHGTIFQADVNAGGSSDWLLATTNLVITGISDGIGGWSTLFQLNVDLDSGKQVGSNACDTDPNLIQVMFEGKCPTPGEVAIAQCVFTGQQHRPTLSMHVDSVVFEAMSANRDEWGKCLGLPTDENIPPSVVAWLTSKDRARGLIYGMIVYCPDCLTGTGKAYVSGDEENTHG